MKNTDQLKDMAHGTGISLYQRFVESEAATFLNISTESLAILRDHSKISHFEITDEPPPQKPDRILRIKEVTEITGMSRTTIWRREIEKDFPRRISLGKSSVGWKVSEIDSWIKSRNSI